MGITFGDDGRPSYLSLPIFFGTGGGTGDDALHADLYEVGATRTDTESLPGGYTITYTVTVREAEFALTSVRVAWDFTYSISLGGSTMMTVTGAATYDVALSGNTLNYSLTLNMEMSQSGISTRQEMTATAQLTRQ